MFGKDFELCQGVGGDDSWEPAVSSSPEPVTLAPVRLTWVLRLHGCSPMAVKYCLG